MIDILKQKPDAIRSNIRKSKIKFINVFPYLCILPIFVLSILFVVKPFCFAVIKSFYNYDGIMLDKFIGFKNYINLIMEDVLLRVGIKNLFVFFVGLIVVFPVATIVAEVLFNLRRENTKKIFSRLILIPIVVPSVAIYMVWKFIYYPEVGLVAQFSKLIGLEYTGFLGNENTVKVALIMMGFPFVSSLNFLMSYSGLQAIDESVIEASKIDGCSTLKRIFYIDIPALKPTLKSLFVLGLISFMQSYEREFIVTGGGPMNASLTPGLHMYNLAFVNPEPQYGYACALAILIFLVTTIASIVLLKRGKE